MKRLFAFTCLLSVATFMAGCSGSEKGKEQSKVASSKLPTLTLLDSASFDFGTINEGDVVEHTFNFKNEGAYPLIINNITSSCGCTTPEWPRDPVVSQSSSSIRVRFDSKNKSGPQAKTITVYANTEPSNIDLKLKGIVKPAAEKETAK